MNFEASLWASDLMPEAKMARAFKAAACMEKVRIKRHYYSRNTSQLWPLPSLERVSLLLLQAESTLSRYS
jgi:hypothetical protein